MEAILSSPLMRWVTPGSGADRLDIVAVGVDQKGGIIGRAVIGARTGTAVIAAAGLQAVGMKALDRGMIGRAERDMRARAAALFGNIEPQRRLARRSKTRAAVVARAQHMAERRQSRRIEAHTGV